jgi:hypothetical protein
MSDRTFVNVYLTDREYGGPEEGGWWFSTGEPVESHEVSEDEADALADTLRQKYSNEGRRPVSSVLSEGEYCVSVEDHEARPWPTEQPHYE